MSGFEKWLSRLQDNLNNAPVQNHIAALDSHFENTWTLSRPLEEQEIDSLKKNGNQAENWESIRVISQWDSDQDLSNSSIARERDFDCSLIHNNRFLGRVLLPLFHGNLEDPEGMPLPCGLYNSVISTSLICNSAIYNSDWICRQWISEQVLIRGSQEISTSPNSRFSLGLRIHPGSETQERSVWLWEGMDLNYVNQSLKFSKQWQSEIDLAIREILQEKSASFGYIGEAAVILGGVVRDCWIGPSTLIDHPAKLSHCLLHSLPDEPITIGTAVEAEFCLMQAAVQVHSGAKLQRSCLLEHSAASLGACVTESIIGPNSQVAKGEINSCFVGPFVGFHHQSLLIAALWPEGKGNIGYGANVGSNHTGKKANQEIRPGEGNFFGLSTSIKFPANFEEAPYSLFATGLTTLPQKICFPFSLINPPSQHFENFSPALNEIFPGWVWWENHYALLRNSDKYAERNRARRHHFNFSIMRADIASLCYTAYVTLESIHTSSENDEISLFFTEQQIEGLGKNVLSTKALEDSLACYRDYLASFLIHYVWRRDSQDLNTSELFSSGLSIGLPKGADPIACDEANAMGIAIDREALLRQIANLFAETLSTDGSSLSSIPLKNIAQQELWRLDAQVARMRISMEREDKRGQKIFSDYALFHSDTENDSVLKKFKHQCQAIRKALE